MVEGKCRKWVYSCGFESLPPLSWAHLLSWRLRSSKHSIKYSPWFLFLVPDAPFQTQQSILRLLHEGRTHERLWQTSARCHGWACCPVRKRMRLCHTHLCSSVCPCLLMCSQAAVSDGAVICTREFPFLHLVLDGIQSTQMLLCRCVQLTTNILCFYTNTFTPFLSFVFYKSFNRNQSSVSFFFFFVRKFSNLYCFIILVLLMNSRLYKQILQ